MQRPDIGEFVGGESEKELREQQAGFLAAMEPERRNSLLDDRKWPIFRVGTTVYVRNDDGAEAKCVVEGIGKKFMRLRGIPR